MPSSLVELATAEEGKTAKDDGGSLGAGGGGGGGRCQTVVRGTGDAAAAAAAAAAAVDLDLLPDDGGLAVVRIKPVGAGAGGVEASATGISDGEGALRYQSSTKKHAQKTATVAVLHPRTREFDYPAHVIPPETDNAALYDKFMPLRVQAFVDGVNVNIMAYGQTGTGKTHTMFGTPGIMDRAGAGEFGLSTTPEYGLFPRAVLDIVARVQRLNAQQQEAGNSKRYALSASSVELSMFMGNRDLMGIARQKQKGESVEQKGKFSVGKGGLQFGVTIDKSAKPPRMFGMTEVDLTAGDEAAVLTVFAGLASRCTAGTGMNDSSSRSHCFVFLTLRAFDADTGCVVESRFQFVDLAGSERMKEAHGTNNWKDAGADGLVGMATNYSLTMLSSCVRAIVKHEQQQRRRRQQQQAGGGAGGSKKSSKQKAFSFRAYLFDVVLLLSESMTGRALTAVFVCLSQAPANASQSLNALDFGSEFAQLPVRPRRVRAVPLATLVSEAAGLLADAEAALAKKIPEKFAIIRGAQKRYAQQALAILRRFQGGESVRGNSLRGGVDGGGK